jgi:HEPN domain-containing protein
MVDGPEFRRWRGLADGALEMARLGTHHNWRCFLAEQAAQMAMKALLHGLGRGPWGHDLVELGKALAEALEGPLDSSLADALRRLSLVSDPADKFTAADAEQAITDAELVVAEVDDIWRQLARDPIAVESVERGLWLVGSAASLLDAGP